MSSQQQNIQITANICHQLHEELILKGNMSINSADILQIVAIIGGIDNILCRYLCLSKQNEAPLTQPQLQQIHQLLENYKNKENTKQSKELVFHFNKQDTYLHLLFDEYASKMINGFIYNKKFLYPMFVLINIGFLQFFRGYISDVYIILPAFVMWIIVIPWLILLLLSVNIEAFKLILKSFDFWLKCLYMILFVALRFIYIHYMSLTVEMDRKNVYWFAYDAIYGVVRLFTIVIWSSLDALQLPLYMKTYLGILISIVYSLNALFISLYAESNGDDSIIHITDSMSISLISYVESSVRIVSIFLWKQTILSIVEKNRCILIKYSPFIQWFDQTNIQTQMAMGQESNIKPKTKTIELTDLQRFQE